jgi:transcription elongation factor Elf1
VQQLNEILDEKNIETGYEHEFVCMIHGMIKVESVEYKKDNRGDVEICPHCGREVRVEYRKRTLKEQKKFNESFVKMYAGYDCYKIKIDNN